MGFLEEKGDEKWRVLGLLATPDKVYDSLLKILGLRFKIYESRYYSNVWI
jgi:hypothetical protein